jgi:hypothetical protein
LRTFFALTFILLSTQALAFEVQFVGPCFEQPLLSQEVDFAEGLNVGEVSIKVLEANQVPYQGVSAGFNQIFGSAIGLDAMEVISDTEMMAYGWCFEVDGEVPEVLADKVPVNKNTKIVSWFYGYAHFLNGEWVAQCLKSHLRKPIKFCSR